MLSCGRILIEHSQLIEPEPKSTDSVMGLQLTTYLPFTSKDEIAGIIMISIAVLIDLKVGLHRTITRRVVFALLNAQLAREIIRRMIIYLLELITQVRVTVK